MTFKLGKSGRAIAAAATLAAVAAVAVSVAPATAATRHAKDGITVYYIPKDTNNPYEVIADEGGKTALTALGNKQVVSSGTEDTAAAQEPSIQTAIQDPNGAQVLLMAAKDVLNKEWRATHPHEQLGIQIDPDTWGGSMVTMP